MNYQIIKRSNNNIIFLFISFIFFSSNLAANNELEVPLNVELRHEKIGVLVQRLIERAHYNHTKVDDDLSSDILNNYIDNLDGNRSYFLNSDLDSFESFRFKIDDMLGPASLQPAFEIFEKYRTRAISRMQYAISILDNEPDFSTLEEYQFDRSDASWMDSAEDLDELWKKRIKNDALNLILNEKEWSETKKLLTKRYERFLTQLQQINNDDVFETFMNSVVHTLDPHSSYFSPRKSEEYQIQMSLSYFGIGASLSIEDEYVSIVNIIPGGPAAIDGQLKPKDRISAIGQGENGEMIDVVGWRLDDVVQLIRGPAETIVRLEISPDELSLGEPTEIISLTRDQVKLEESAAKSKLIKTHKNNQKYNIGVIDIPSFYRDFNALTSGDDEFTSTTSDVKRLLSDFEKENIDALIIDLRNNGGGHLTEATALSGLFIDNGPIVQLRNARGRISRLDDPDPVPRSIYNGPLIVLVNRYSASASEIFAAAIQDYDRGVIVGQQTFGKGTVQNLYPLDRYVKNQDEEELGQLTLTIGKYYRITGESTQNRGVNPDIELPSYIDIDTTGESARKTALPWDTIRSSRYKSSSSLQKIISELNRNHQMRLKEDPNLIYLNEDTLAIKDAKNRKLISLNAEIRTREREQAQENQKIREEKRDQLNSETVNNDLESEESKEVINEDIHLNEAAAIATDLVIIRDNTMQDNQQANVY